MQTRTQMFTSAAEVPHSTRRTCNRYETFNRKKASETKCFQPAVKLLCICSFKSICTFLWTCVIRRLPEESCFQIQGWCVQWVLAPVCTDFQGWAEKHSSVKMSIYEDRKSIWLDFFFSSIYLRISVSSHHHFLEYCWRIRYPGTKDFPVPATHTHTKPQHIMFRRDSDTWKTLGRNTLEVPCGGKSCYTTSYGKFKPSFKYFSGK